MLIRLDRLSASPLNPRGPVVEDDDLRDLAASLKSHGLIQPLTVRELRRGMGLFEVVCGHRRLAAASLAGLAEVECTVVSIGDAEALEIMLVENSARRDVPPTQEADALQRLVGMGKDPAELAERLGRSRKWVRDRMILGRLPAEARAALDDGRIGLRTAVVIGSLPEETAKAVAGRLGGDQRCSHETVLSWVGWASRRLLVAPWGETEELGPRACRGCQHRSDAQPDLWADLISSHGETCLDAACWQAKVDELKRRAATTVKGHVTPRARASGVDRAAKLSDGTSLASVLPDDIAMTAFENGPYQAFLVDVDAAAAHLRSIGLAEDAKAIEDECRLWEYGPRAEATAPAPRTVFPTNKEIDAAMAALVARIELAVELPLEALVRALWGGLWSDRQNDVRRRRGMDNIEEMMVTTERVALYSDGAANDAMELRKRRHLSGLLVELATARDAGSLRSVLSPSDNSFVELLEAFGLAVPAPREVAS